MLCFPALKTLSAFESVFLPKPNLAPPEGLLGGDLSAPLPATLPLSILALLDPARLPVNLPSGPRVRLKLRFGRFNPNPPLSLSEL